MQNDQLLFDGLSIEIIRKPIKHLYVRVKPPDAQVSINTPLYASIAHIQHVLASKKNWIREARNRCLAEHAISHPTSKLMTGALIPFLGTNYLLSIRACEEKPRLFLSNNFLVCELHDCSSLDLAQLSQWYRQQFYALLPPLIDKWQNHTGIKIKDVRLKQMKTRWGSCNTVTRGLWLNLHLVKKPLICIEYVLLHEMLHLLEKGHNRHFYALMTQFMPDWKNHHRHLHRPTVKTDFEALHHA